MKYTLFSKILGLLGFYWLLIDKQYIFHFHFKYEIIKLDRYYHFNNDFCCSTQHLVFATPYFLCGVSQPNKERVT